MNKPNFKYISILVAGLLLLLTGLFVFRQSSSPDIKSIAQRFEKQLAAIENETAQYAQKFINNSEQKPADSLFNILNNTELQNLALNNSSILVYENDSLKYWTNNEPAVENQLKNICLSNDIEKLSNGWYRVINDYTLPLKKRKIITLIKIKNEYPYQNQYLTEVFTPNFSFAGDFQLSKFETESTTPIHDSTNKTLVYIVKPASNDNMLSSNWQLILFLISFSLLAYGFEKLIFATTIPSKFGNINLSIFTGSILLLRILMIQFKLPEALYMNSLFGPDIYGDSSIPYFGSLGDLILNSITLCYLAWVTVKYSSTQNTENHKVKLILSLATLYFLAHFLNLRAISLVNDSHINFTFSNLFALTSLSYIAVIITGILLLGFSFICFKLLKWSTSENEFNKMLFPLLVITPIINYFLQNTRGNYDLTLICWPSVLIAYIYLFRINRVRLSLITIIGLLLLYTVYTAHIFSKFPRTKEHNARLVYAEQLHAEQDPLAEHLFSEVEDKIVHDSLLIKLLTPKSLLKEEFSKSLKQKYFSGYWDKYDIKTFVFDSLCFPIIKTQNPLRDNLNYFENIIKHEGKTTESANLFYFTYQAGKTSLLGKLPLIYDDSKLGTLFIEFTLRFATEQGGFPELLLDKKSSFDNNLSNYSYAKYNNNQLLNYHGKYQYSLNELNTPINEERYSYFISNGFDHLVYKPTNETTIIISKHNDGWVGLFTLFSFVFTILGLFTLVILIPGQIRSKQLLFLSSSLKNRLQFFLVGIVLITLFLFGSGTIFYISSQFHQKNKEALNEKSISVLAQLQRELGSEKSLNTINHDYLLFILNRISTTLFTDINLYDNKGSLLTSSKMKLFNEGLISKKLNSVAYREIAIQQSTQFIHDETIGELSYLSAYMPFKNDKGAVLGYINLPYFAKQSDLEREIATFISALINIYVLLFGVSLILALIIANYVTKPLQLIQEKLAHITLNKTNEPIYWKQKDEIGSLVKEYNRMIEELAKSANLLARSERESAWREMARQVAHEIKNPLTPMKLSVQHLQRTWADKSEDMDKKIERITKTLIEQIDTLSHIASEFSDFAKMPKAHNSKISLNDVIENTIELFRSEPNLNIQFNNQCASDPFVYADRDQLTRVFNNLIKNAVQAIPENKKGEINITLKTNNNKLLISISDNGTGIPNELVSKIFTPNFTTKTGGMGLGLSMVKSIIESLNGKIFFETSTNGTTFYIELNPYTNHEQN